MDFSPSTLFAGFVFGVIGMYLVKQGRKDAHVPWIAFGVAMIGYPYFVSGAWLTWGIGAVLLVGAFLLR